MKFFLLVFAAFLALSGSALAEYGERTMVLHPGFALQQGPEQARGAIIWSPGYAEGHPDAETGGMPHVLDWVYGHGWDVFYMERVGGNAESDRTMHAAAIANGVAGLRDAGYRKVVLAGQSSGGTYSLIAAQQDLGIDGMVLMASGPSGGSVSFEQLLAQAQARSFIVFHFANDKTIGKRERGPVDQVLAAKAGPAFHVYEPAGYDGHDSGFLSTFSKEYGDCILGFLNSRSGAGCNASR